MVVLFLISGGAATALSTAAAPSHSPANGAVSPHPRQAVRGVSCPDPPPPASSVALKADTPDSRCKPIACPPHWREEWGQRPQTTSPETTAPNHLALCRLLLLPPSTFPSIRVFSSESAVHIRWPKYWSFSFSLSPSDEHSGLTSFRMGWFV